MGNNTKLERTLAACSKHLIQPDKVPDSYWPSLRQTCQRDVGIEFCRWQDDAANIILGRRANGMLSTTVSGVGMSMMRQVGKTYLFIGMIFTLCLDQPNLKVLWTAHNQRTHQESFMVMQAFAQQERIKPWIKKVYLGSGDEEIRFNNGSRILFGSRERGFGRGMSNVDILVFDEAQILSDRAMQNMLASMNISQFGLHIYVGTPPKPTDNSEVFTRMRNEALSGESEGLVWIEMGAPDDCDIDDPAVFECNPSYPHWTPGESIMRLRKKLDPDGFRREGLGIWPARSWAVFDVAKWVQLEDRSAVAPSRVALAIDVSPYRLGATIGVAGDYDGKTLVLVHSAAGTGWVGAKVAELVEAHDIAEVSLTSGEARGLEGDLTQLDVEFKKLTSQDVAAGCTAFQAAVADGAVVHVGQQELDVAVANARTRRMGECETWDRDFAVDISALVAAATAAHRWACQESPLPAIF
jgi:phage terminase large subunit-like protein